MNNLESVDWSQIPEPPDDGGADHLVGAELPPIALRSTSGGSVELASLPGCSVVYAYPMTGRPDVALPDGWEQIPGARGCTPQSCAYRDLVSELLSSGVDRVFGLSTQDSGYQQEAVDRLHLPYELLSDDSLALAAALDLPTMEVNHNRLLRRLTMVINDGLIGKVFYPIFPPDQDAQNVIDWLTAESKR